MSFLQSLWIILVVFAFVCYLMILWTILTDLFRDRNLHGGWKAAWVVCMFIFPLLTALVYMIARGRGMAERQRETIAAAKRQQDDYIRSVVEKDSPTQQIADAKDLLDRGVIDTVEFERLKEHAMASAQAPPVAGASA